MSDRLREAAAEVFARAVGHPPPMEPFAAVITGAAKVWKDHQQFDASGALRDAPNVPLAIPFPTTNPPTTIDFDDCTTRGTPNADGFYVSELLPRGVWPCRYRWTAVRGSLHSEACGFREEMDTPGEWVPWRQAFYAVNVSHGTLTAGSASNKEQPWIEDPKLNYPYLRLGTIVIMAWGDISAITGGSPAFGFFFTHRLDFPRTVNCKPAGGSNPLAVGCCIQFFVGGCTDPTNFDCVAQIFCAHDADDCSTQAGGQPTLFLGDGVDCADVIDPFDGSIAINGFNCLGTDDIQSGCCIFQRAPDGTITSQSCTPKDVCDQWVANDPSGDSSYLGPCVDCPPEPLFPNGEICECFDGGPGFVEEGDPVFDARPRIDAAGLLYVTPTHELVRCV